MTMMTELAVWIKEHTKESFDPKEQHIRCLAHVINLATQATLNAHSKTPHYDPKETDTHLPETEVWVHDPVGLIRAICVKERSSAKRKEIYRALQIDNEVKRPTTLLLNMVVHWSSTYVMLERAYHNKQVHGLFIY
jgi:hypothetical protein